MDQIKIGLDFGTHQTKICVQHTPDEGHGEPNYEFFQFSDLQGNNTYFLPSVIQINDDDTLSYGYVDASRKKAEPDAPQKESPVLEDTFDVAYLANGLYTEYATSNNTQEDIRVLEKMLQIRLRNIMARNKKRQEEAEWQHESQVRDHKQEQNIFRYFKQATFIGGEWNRVLFITKVFRKGTKTMQIIEKRKLRVVFRKTRTNYAPLFLYLHRTLSDNQL